MTTATLTPVASRQHLVRVGVLGQVGRFTAVDLVRYPRGLKVIVRTSRGLEVGEILAPPSDDLPNASADGSILRGMTVEDQLLDSRLQKNRDAALLACESRLRDLNHPVTLLDVEHLFDGRSLFFYFLGEVPPEIEMLTDELAELYDAEVQFRKFAETVTEGCGPGCGTENATGGGCSSCSTGCAIADACGTRKK